jgi:uncharacterized protein YeaO (DUF488 family)
VKKADYARRDYYDLWLPELAPSAPVVSWAHAGEWTEARWRAYVRRYLREMRAQRRLIAALAALSRQADFSIGCYCEDAALCHRSLLADLLREAGAEVIPAHEGAGGPFRQPRRSTAASRRGR